VSEDKLIAFIKDIASAIGTARVEFEKGTREVAMGIPSTRSATQEKQEKDTSSDYL